MSYKPKYDYLILSSWQSKYRYVHISFQYVSYLSKIFYILPRREYQYILICFVTRLRFSKPTNILCYLFVTLLVGKLASFMSKSWLRHCSLMASCTLLKYWRPFLIARRRPCRHFQLFTSTISVRIEKKSTSVLPFLFCV